MPKQIKKQVTFAGDPKKTKKKEIKNKSDMSWWKEHCKWVDSFRGKIIKKNGE